MTSSNGLDDSIAVFSRRHRCVLLADVLSSPNTTIASDKIQRLRAWAVAHGLTVADGLLPILALCDSASEVRFALTFANSPSWHVAGDHMLTDGRLTLAVQHNIAGYFADFVLSGNELPQPCVIEIDGPTHFTVEGTKADIIRQRVLEGRGYRVLRLWSGRVREVAATIGPLLLERHIDSLI